MSVGSRKSFPRGRRHSFWGCRTTHFQSGSADMRKFSGRMCKKCKKSIPLCLQFSCSQNQAKQNCSLNIYYTYSTSIKQVDNGHKGIPLCPLLCFENRVIHGMCLLVADGASRSEGAVERLAAIYPKVQDLCPVSVFRAGLPHLRVMRERTESTHFGVRCGRCLNALKQKFKIKRRKS